MNEVLRRKLIDCVPDSWLDPLLTGPSKVISDPLTNNDIERVLRGVKDRIVAVCDEATVLTVPYPQFCRHKDVCAGLTSCPNDPGCCE